MNNVEWIPIKDNLPETFIVDNTPCYVQGKKIGDLIESRNVLVALSDGRVEVDSLCGIDKSGDPWFDCFGIKVTHWSELPKHPTAEYKK